MSALRNRIARLEQMATPVEEDPVRCIFLVAPFRETRPPSRGYQHGEITAMRETGETDAQLERRCEQMSGPRITLWAELA